MPGHFWNWSQFKPSKCEHNQWLLQICHFDTSWKSATHLWTLYFGIQAFSWNSQVIEKQSSRKSTLYLNTLKSLQQPSPSQSGIWPSKFTDLLGLAKFSPNINRKKIWFVEKNINVMYALLQVRLARPVRNRFLVCEQQCGGLYMIWYLCIWYTCILCICICIYVCICIWYVNFMYMICHIRIIGILNIFRSPTEDPLHPLAAASPRAPALAWSVRI